MWLTRLDRYIIKKFLGTFFYAISLLAGIIIVFDLSEKIGDFLQNKAPLTEIIFDYYLNFLPYFINLFSYLFVFIAVVFFTAKLAGNTEIIAILSSGISFNRLLRPYLLGATLLALLSFVLANFVIPHTNVNMRRFEQKYISNLQKDIGTNVHFQIAKNNFIYCKSFDRKTNTITDFAIEKMDDNGVLVFKLNAHTAVYDSTANTWQLKQYYKRYIDKGEEHLRIGAVMDTTLALTPKDLIVVKEDHKEMDFFEIRRYVAAQKLKGSANVVEYEVEQHKRMAYPFASLILTIIGVSLSSRKIRGGIGMHLGFGILLTFVYILFMQFATVFAVYGGLLPIIAAWIPNIIFMVIAVVLLRNAPK